MKRICALLALTVVLLSGCSQKPAEDAVFSTGDVDKLVSAGVFSEELEELDGDVIYALYGLSNAGLEREQLTDCKVLRSAGATCEEAAVLILDEGVSQELVDDVRDVLGEYLEEQIEANTDYRPAEIPKLEDPVLRSEGDTVLMVVSNEGSQAVIDALGLD